MSCYTCYDNEIRNVEMCYVLHSDNGVHFRVHFVTFASPEQYNDIDEDED